MTPLEEGDTAGRSSSSDAPSSTSRFVSVAGPVTESIMDRLRGEGYVYVGRQRTSSTFVPHLSQRESLAGPLRAIGHVSGLSWQASRTHIARVAILCQAMRCRDGLVTHPTLPAPDARVPCFTCCLTLLDRHIPCHQTQGALSQRQPLLRRPQPDTRAWWVVVLDQLLA